MKKTSQNCILGALLFVTVFNSQVLAQKLDKDALAFTKTYEEKYNKGDLAALMDMYANEITAVYGDGKSEKLDKSFYEADYIRDFGEAAGTHFALKVANTEKLADGKIKISGTFDGYDFDRKSNAKLNPTVGTFENIIVKDGGKWKFSQIKTVFAMEQASRDVRALVQKFQDAYNKEDASAIGSFFTADGQWITADGKTTKGADNIKAEYAETFKNSNASATLKMANAQPQFDGSIITSGTYSVYGVSTAGDRVSSNGSFMNKLVNENGQWKLAEVKQGNLIKTVVYHKVADFSKWKASFDAFRRIRRDAGELSFEAGTLADDPSTVYIISEWESVDKAKAFFALPELTASRQKAGETAPMQIMYLSKK